jgi:hypothetical protein
MPLSRTCATLVACLLFPTVAGAQSANAAAAPGSPGEAGNGRRVQRWILKGTRPATSWKARRRGLGPNSF